ncbi:cytochrome P450 [Wolfiporia cocos MD-104 SS10]|uniref:Cytochrome P450 n=1 Tax=Wolfiporia cocos (strain MD-104) TaxID=742152 RepID=A0A2H3JIL5_WOLCO|nr:cytochrome P450 [Wolfiporia cocos MD-104 SS10]
MYEFAQSLPLILAMGLVGLAIFYANRQHRPQLPPGPLGLPIVGNALQIPGSRQWLKFAEWAKTYGPIVHVTIFGQHTIILNSREIVSELLEDRSAIYSERPHFRMAGDLMGFSEFIFLLPNGDRLRQSRSHSSIGISHTLEQKVVKFANELSRSPEHFQSHIETYVAGIILQIIHGHKVEDHEDDLLSLAQQLNKIFHAGIAAGAWWVDSIPILQYVPSWIPGAGFKRKAREWRKVMERFRDEPYDLVKAQATQGTAQPSMTRELVVGNVDDDPGMESLNKYISSAVYGAGADTSVSAIESFFLAMSLHPEVQSKAQAELDYVLGPGILPKVSDRHNLPYVAALLQEIHRWNPVAPLGMRQSPSGLPHAVAQDDYYGDYLIPAGSTVVANIWALLHDSALYPNPMEFFPERFLDKSDADINPDPRLDAFGYGRRVCPGKNLADDTLFMAVATVLALFTINKPIGPDGSIIEPTVDYSGSISHNVPFGCRIVTRSEDIAQFLRAMDA